MAIPIDLSTRKRATVRPDGSARFRCPECGATCVLKPDTAVRPSTPVRTFYRCDCGIGHTVYLCTRAARTTLDTSATLFHTRTNIRLPARLRNVSRSGLLIEVEDALDMHLGEEIVLHFELPMPAPSRFFKHAAVRRIDKQQVGAEFVGIPDQNLERALAACCIEFGAS